MALIEGVGDEVTLLLGVLLLLLVLLLAWASTHTSEPSDQLFNPPPAPDPASSLPSTSSSSHQTPPPSTGTDSDRSEPLTPPPAQSKQGEAEPSGELGGDVGGQEGGQGVFGGDGVRHREGAASSSSSLLSERGRVEPQRNMVLRLKFLNDTERTAHVKPHDTIGYIKRTYFEGQEQQVRLIYQGQLLQDDSQTLASLNLTDNCVLHCHISQHATRSSPAGVRPPDQVQVALNVGSLMVPLFMLMLSVLWYCQIQYRQFFTAPATASLVGVTIFFSLVAFGVYRR
ncbi:transmembrane and ubiquitin-like domain-containing protein 1 [Lampris incognitus]|uniref:transmembrane and ubiquitin-like domain-containing protein 1 n=1 Tax=Lampris incognitus TaxID=2546036 RepID=UPI0024B5AB32|nr:transmembrane and ubiquitin-like domain-containing protein 1 [Lampris incognitus]